MPKQIQPNFILDVEKSELNIQAGLQDRVVQVNKSTSFSLYLNVLFPSWHILIPCHVHPIVFL